MRSLKILLVLLLSLGLVGTTGDGTLVAAADSHVTHFVSDKGPQLPQDETGCTACHAAGNLQCDPNGPLFKNVASPDGPALSLDDTDVCDKCHSPGGAFPGANGLDDPDIGAKANWEDGVYEPDGTTLKPGKEKWCATCHDDAPAHSKVDGETGVDAPNVAVDSSQVYGYYISGHGRPGAEVKCEECHDLTGTHIDGEHRTYDASTYPNSNYRVGYRLNNDMIIPRTTQLAQSSFNLCFDSCHVYSDVFSECDTNFRRDDFGDGFHNMHLEGSTSFASWDSDWNDSIDSTVSCPACHNVHGSPTPVMTRHGELISTPGTTDRVPALDFMWFLEDRVTPTTVVEASRWGSLRNPGATGDVTTNNHVCTWCHSWSTESPRGDPEDPKEYIDYHRIPEGAGTATIRNVKTTNLNNVKKFVFAPGEAIKYHVAFTITGSGSYFVKAGDISKAQNTSGNDWSTLLRKNNTLSAGDYSWKWTKTIPIDATPGSGAEATVRINMFDAPGGCVIDKSNIFTRTFSIAP